MAEVFIDANMFLDFYLTELIGKLIDVLDDVSDQILITDQVYNEVERNKVDVAKRYLEQTTLKSCPQFNVQYHLLSSPEIQKEELRKKINKFNAQAKLIHKEVEEAFTTLLHEIALSRDPISRSLMRLFDQRLQPTEEEMNRARLRKELGNPPGKSSDRLGDQLTWEQFLSRVVEHDKVWIITRDGDYFQTLPDKSLVLNPILHRELRHINPNIEVRCFSKLSDGIDNYISQLPEKPIHTPTDEEFTNFSNAESYLHTIKPATLVWGPNLPSVCPICDARNSYFEIGYVPSQFGGGRSLHYQCNKCGAKFDSRDYAD